MAKRKKAITPEMVALIRRAGDSNPEIARAAMREMAIALTLPLKKGVLKGDILDGIFDPIEFPLGAAIEFPLDLLSPGTEKDHVAYSIPNHGKIPQRNVQGDYVMVPTFNVGNSIDCNLRYLTDGRWDVVGRMMQVLEGGFTRKRNNDGWHTILAASVARNIAVYDGAATAGLFSKRLVSLMETQMRRSAGGNSTSINRGKLTDLYVSPESLGDIRSWDLTQIDEFTRREIFLAGGDETQGLTKIFGILLHDIDEFGVGQEYQNYYSNTLGGTLPSDKTEIVVGLDLVHDDSFVNPIRRPIQVFEDMTLHRELRVGWYGFGEHGFAQLDSRRSLIGAV